MLRKIKSLGKHIHLPHKHKKRDSETANAESSHTTFTANPAVIKVGEGEADFANITQENMNYMQSLNFLSRFETSTAVNGQSLINDFKDLNKKFDVPYGAINALMVVLQYAHHLMVDDSYSMTSVTDAKVSEAHPLVRKRIDPHGKRAKWHGKMTRWEEVQSRLHILIDLLALLPINYIKLTFLNRGDAELSHNGLSPQEFANYAHGELFKLFEELPNEKNKTPLHGKLNKAYQETNFDTIFHIYTDGEPTDAKPEDMQRLIAGRDFDLTPTTINGCSDKPIKWAINIEKAPGVRKTSQVDDYKTQKNLVKKNQGKGFHYSYGMWLMQQFLGSIIQIYDNIDEPVLFKKVEYDWLHGTKSSLKEYKHYFDHHPQKKSYNFEVMSDEKQQLDPKLINPNLYTAQSTYQNNNNTTSTNGAYDQSMYLPQADINLPPQTDVNSPQPQYSTNYYGDPNQSFQQQPQQQPWDGFANSNPSYDQGQVVEGAPTYNIRNAFDEAYRNFYNPSQENTFNQLQNTYYAPPMNQQTTNERMIEEQQDGFQIPYIDIPQGSQTLRNADSSVLFNTNASPQQSLQQREKSNEPPALPPRYFMPDFPR